MVSSVVVLFIPKIINLSYYYICIFSITFPLAALQLPLQVVVLTATINNELACIPPGFHNFVFWVFSSALMTACTLITDAFLGTPVPFWLLMSYVVIAFILPFLLSVNVIKLSSDHTAGSTRVVWNIGSWCHFPPRLRFDRASRSAVRASIPMLNLVLLFTFLYPILGGVFLQLGIIGQGAFIPCFFALRVLFEYLSESIVTKAFGCVLFLPRHPLVSAAQYICIALDT